MVSVAVPGWWVWLWAGRRLARSRLWRIVLPCRDHDRTPSIPRPLAVPWWRHRHTISSLGCCVTTVASVRVFRRSPCPRRVSPRDPLSARQRSAAGHAAGARRGVRLLDGGIVTLTALNAMTHLQLGSVPGRSSSEVLLWTRDLRGTQHNITTQHKHAPLYIIRYGHLIFKLNPASERRRWNLWNTLSLCCVMVGQIDIIHLWARKRKFYEWWFDKNAFYLFCYK